MTDGATRDYVPVHIKDCELLEEMRDACDICFYRHNMPVKAAFCITDRKRWPDLVGHAAKWHLCNSCHRREYVERDEVTGATLAHNVEMQFDGYLEVEQMAALLRALSRIGFKSVEYHGNKLTASKRKGGVKSP